MPHQVDVDQAKVCVIIIAYKHEKYIEKCIESVLAQETNFPFYIYVAEDQSPDNTRELCKDYAQRFPEKIVLALNHRENNMSLQGRPSARHNIFHALLDTKGKYCCLFEGDDFWNDTQKLQRQYDFLEANPDYTALYTDAYVVNESERKLKEDSFISPNSYDFEWEQSLQKKHGAALTLMYRRSALDTVQYAKLIADCAVGDWPMEVLLGLKGKGHRMNIATSTYIRRDGGSTLNYLVKPFVYHNSRIAFLQALVATDLLDDQQENTVKRFLSKLHWMRAAENFMHAKYQGWKSDLKQCLLYYRSSKAGLPKQTKWAKQFQWKNLLKQSFKYHLVGIKNRF